MSLDLFSTAEQIERLASDVRLSGQQASERLERAFQALSQADITQVNHKAELSRGVLDFLAARPVEKLDTTHLAAPLLSDFHVVAVDGSHIDVDRHIPVPCYLINIGCCILTYGTVPDARLYSQSKLYSKDEELYIYDPQSHTRRTPVERAVLGLRRTVDELRHLAGIVREVPGVSPILALVDGSLVLWELTGHGYESYVRDSLLRDTFLPAMDMIKAESAKRPVILAAYVSLPRSTEVVNALRLHFCPYEQAACRRHCGELAPRQRPCDVVNDFLDRTLYQRLLHPGERSALFASDSSIVRDYYGSHKVYFYYLNCGEEIVRIELPEWVALNEQLLSIGHAMILDQCQKGFGYPAAITEAHEQAVLTVSDRQQFKNMLEAALTEQGVQFYTSEKDRSKRLRVL